ncbi:SH3 domain-containing protein [bacterium]|nr:SH3 domain-containing protein [bacterium]
MLRKYIILCFLLVNLSGCASLQIPAGPPYQERATLPLFNCTLEMDQPEYWINKYIFRDHLLLTKKQIRKINRKNITRGLLTNVFTDKLWDYRYVEVDRPGEDNPEWEWNLERPSAYSPGILEGYTLYTYLKDETERIKRKQRWDSGGEPICQKTFAALDDNLNLNAIQENNPVRYGLTLRRTNVRYYPTELLVTGKRWNVNFDIVQVSSVRALQPLAIMHSSRDQAWVFVVTAYCRGWIKRSDILEDCNPKKLERYIKPKRFLVITGHKVEAVEAPGTTIVAEKLYMGTVCPLLGRTKAYYVVGFPKKKKNGDIIRRKIYISRAADVHQGYLAYTPRNICQQAFKLLHTPYAWGGMNEYRDCSQVIMDVYATMGFILPRNSSSQARVGSGRYTFARKNNTRQRQAKLNKIKHPVLLQFPGHIMLYLGSEGDIYYAIHDIWAYRVLDKPKKDRKIIIGEVVVSDLSLGEGSTKGSLLERLKTINFLRP